MNNWKNNFNRKPNPITPGCTRMIVDIPNEFLTKLKEHKIPFTWAMKFFMDTFFKSMKEQENADRTNTSPSVVEETKQETTTEASSQSV